MTTMPRNGVDRGLAASVWRCMTRLWRPLLAALCVVAITGAVASEGEKPVARNYVMHPPAPAAQTAAAAAQKSEGCASCHTATDH